MRPPIALLLAAAARIAAADRPQEQAWTKLATLGPAGLPAVCGTAAFGMRDDQLPAVWPEFHKDDGFARYGGTMVIPVYDSAAHMNGVHIAVSPALELPREIAALENAWGAPAFTTDVAAVWLWPEERKLGVKAVHPFASEPVVWFELPNSEYGSVQLRGNVGRHGLEDVSLEIGYPEGALPRVLDVLRARGGAFAHETTTLGALSWLSVRRSP